MKRIKKGKKMRKRLIQAVLSYHKHLTKAVETWNEYKLLQYVHPSERKELARLAGFGDCFNAWE